MGFGRINGGDHHIYANSTEENEDDRGSPGSASSDSRSTDFEWYVSFWIGQETEQWHVN